jgi:hypothetical protein
LRFFDWIAFAIVEEVDLLICGEEVASNFSLPSKNYFLPRNSPPTRCRLGMSELRPPLSSHHLPLSSSQVSHFNR